jgi:hypothetical protein
LTEELTIAMGDFRQTLQKECTPGATSQNIGTAELIVSVNGADEVVRILKVITQQDKDGTGMGDMNDGSWLQSSDVSFCIERD